MNKVELLKRFGKNVKIERIKKDLKQFYEDSKELNIQGGPIDEDMFSH